MAVTNFAGHSNNPHAQEAKERWPSQFEASQGRLKAMSPQAQRALFETADETHRSIAELFLAGAAASDTEVQRLIGKHFDWVTSYWLPNREAYIGLGEMYVADPRFTETYDGFAKDLAPFMLDSMRIWAEANLN
jgi:hypothetical protein